MGGGGSVSQSKTSSRSQGQSFLPSQAAALNKTLGAFDPRIGQNRFFGGPTLAPFTDFQQNILGQGQGLANAFGNLGNIQDDPLFSDLRKTTGDLIGGRLGAQPLGIDRANELFQGSRINPAQQQFSQFQQPLIREEFSGPGFFGSPRANAVTREAGLLGQGLEAERNQFLTGVEQQNINIAENQAARQAAGLPIAAAVTQLPTQDLLAKQQGLNQLFNFASVEQQQEQAQLDDNRNRFLEMTAFMAPDDQALLLGLLGLDFQTESSKAHGRSFGTSGQGGVITTGGS